MRYRRRAAAYTPTCVLRGPRPRISTTTALPLRTHRPARAGLSCPHIAVTPYHNNSSLVAILSRHSLPRRESARFLYGRCRPASALRAAATLHWPVAGVHVLRQRRTRDPWRWGYRLDLVPPNRGVQQRGRGIAVGSGCRRLRRRVHVPVASGDENPQNIPASILSRQIAVYSKADRYRRIRLGRSRLQHRQGLHLAELGCTSFQELGQYIRRQVAVYRNWIALPVAGRWRTPPRLVPFAPAATMNCCH